MNECEQLHPLLRGYLDDTLSAWNRRIVARHLNLCASARRELDQLRGGGPKTPVSSANPPSEPLDLKILRWLFKAPKPSQRKGAKIPAPKPQARKEVAPLAPKKRTTAWKPILFVLLIFAALFFLTHFIQNAGDLSFVQGAKRWMSKNHVFGVKPSLDLVLDLTNQPHWSGDKAPVAVFYQELITDSDHFKLYWALLQPGQEVPNVDFSKNAMVLVFLGPKAAPGSTVRFKRMENYTDRTILWYDEAVFSGAAGSQSTSTCPWVLQEVPVPAQTPVSIQKIS